MNFNFLLIIILLLTSCTTIKSSNNSNKKIYNKFSNKGFTLIYSDSLFKDKIINKKLKERDLVVFQKNLKKGTSIKISNLINEKSIIAKVGVKAKYPSFNNSVISKRIAEELELNLKEPYVEINEIIHNETFIAKKAKIYDIEKKVADKAPVDTITINNLNKSNISKDKKAISSKFIYSIKVADFYFEDSAKTVKKRINQETDLDNITIFEITEKKFSVILGPYYDLNSLKNAYNTLYSFSFENLEIIKND
tara:strand:- start:310 stop:1062 length:753 start_codon:yes stop_codon:yes gene_type:complete